MKMPKNRMRTVMTVEGQLSRQRILDIEESIKNGQDNLVSDYFHDAVNYHVNDTKTLEHRKRIILDGCVGHLPCMQYFAILSALTNDRAGWDADSSVAADRMHPALGFHARWYQMKYRPEFAKQPKWSILLETSVSLGHFHSRIVAFHDATESMGLLKVPLRYLHRILMKIIAIPVIIKDPKDKRLPRASDT